MWGSHVLRVLSNITKKRWGSHVLRMLSKITPTNGGGCMSPGCSHFLCLKHVFLCVVGVFLLLCNISQIATGVPYSESPRNKTQIAPILINIGCNLTCFGPVQSFDLLGWGSHVLRVLSNNSKKRWGSTILENVKITSK
jgi:hypothetical protein